MDRWWIACASAQLGKQPLAAQVLDLPLVLFRAKGVAQALVDRCPHRGVPLSLGRCHKGRIACAYHGWEFDGAGVCHVIPSDLTPVSPRKLVESFVVVERDGYVWVRSEAAEPPRLWLPGFTGLQHTFKFERAADVVRLQLLGHGEVGAPLGVEHDAHRLAYFPPNRFELLAPAEGQFAPRAWVGLLVPTGEASCRLEVAKASPRPGHESWQPGGELPFELAPLELLEPWLAAREPSGWRLAAVP